MSSDGYIVTNKHVIAEAEQIIVALQSGEIFNAKLIGEDRLTDLAILKIDGRNNLPTIPQNLKRPPVIGDIVLAIGNPYNLGQSVSQGIISALGRNASGNSLLRQDLIQTDTPINRGNSGGALINTLGELVGINALSIGKNFQEVAEGLNFAVPIDTVKNVMNKIIQQGYVSRGYLGAEADILFNNGNGKEEQGVLIKGILPNSPADQAGILANDIITHFDNQALHSPAQLIRLVMDYPPHSLVKVNVLRNGEPIELMVSLGEFILDEEQD